MLGPCKTDQLPAEKGAGVSLWYVAMKLGLSGRSPQWLLGHVRQLIDRHNFPPPFPHYMLDGTRREGITRASRWHRAAVDAWLDGFLPPEMLLAVEDRRAAEDAARLDQRAAELAGLAA